MRTRLAGAVAAGACVLAACGTAGAVPAGTTSEGTPGPTATGAPSRGTGPGQLAGPASWPGYHADQARTGAVPAPAPSVPRVSSASPVSPASSVSSVSSAPVRSAWSADLGAAVYGQPVVAGGRVLAATEGDRVVALDPATGRTVWSVSLGTPLTHVADVAGCGNVDPLGITSTPVVDLQTNTVFVVAEVVDAQGSVHHRLEGLSVATGAVRVAVDVDPPLPPGEQAVHLLQRAGFALGNGRVYVAYGGNSGDCGTYHGWVVGVMESGPPRPVSFEVAPDGEGGAIWASGGAPALDGRGTLYVTTGNANPGPPQGGPDPKRYTESVVVLSPDLRPLASFKDRVAGGDEDLSTSNPVLLPDGTVFAVGKTEIGFVLSQRDLSQVAAIGGICGSDPDGGPGYDRATNRLFVPCRDGGIQVVDLASRALGPRLAGANGPPILVGDRLWAVDYPGGTLVQFDAATGRALQTVAVGSTVPHFTSPSAGLGLVLVGTDHGVTAFR